jgi:hypothetical protein
MVFFFKQGLCFHNSSKQTSFTCLKFLKFILYIFSVPNSHDFLSLQTSKELKYEVSFLGYKCSISLNKIS